MLNTPYGIQSLGRFEELSVNPSEVIVSKAQNIPRIRLNFRQLCDFELLLTGAFAPLLGFMGEKDYLSVARNKTLANSLFWPMPINLDIPLEKKEELQNQTEVALLHPEQELVLGVLSIDSIYPLRKDLEAENIFKTQDITHPALSYLNRCGDFAVGGDILWGIRPPHFDYPQLRKTPQEVRKLLAEKNPSSVVAFQTRNPIHGAHYELTRRAMDQIQGNLLLHPVVGQTKPGDIDMYTRVRCYSALLPHYPPGRAELSLLPLAMRMAGPLEALWHMIIRKNFGCSHFIVGRDHAGPGKDSHGNFFYDPQEAPRLAHEMQKEIGINVIPFAELVFSESLNRYCEPQELPSGTKALNISGTDFRKKLDTGEPIPSWYSFPEVISELKKGNPPKNKKGVCLFFTGLSGAGKTTVARGLLDSLKSHISEPITFLDGDEVRLHLSKGLGFSKEDRDTNILRIGYVASLVVKHRGWVVCTAISPYNSVREQVRAMCEEFGSFVLIHVATPLEACEQRDPKGLYQKARKGELKQFTGIDDPYEDPSTAELTLDTSKTEVKDSISLVLNFLKNQGLLNAS